MIVFPDDFFQLYYVGMIELLQRLKQGEKENQMKLEKQMCLKGKATPSILRKGFLI